MQCQKYKTARKIRPPFFHFPTTSRFETVHIDLVGPLRNDRGFEYILTMLDRASRWPEAFALKNIDSETICTTFLSTWICRFGAPKHIITDQGRQFESKLFNTLVENIGATRIHTSAYHPQSNGAIERFHRTFKTSLKILTDRDNRWVDVIPFGLFGWRNTPNTTTETSPTQTLYGTSIRFLTDLTDCNPTPSDRDIMNARKRFLDQDSDKYFTMPSSFKDFLPANLYAAKYLWLKNHTAHGFQPTYTGPHKVIELFSHNAKVLKDGKEVIVHLTNT